MEIALGFIIAVFISLTGVGAGSLTTPLLILLLGLAGQGVRRYGADLRDGGEGRHGARYIARRQVNWRVFAYHDRGRIARRDRGRFPDGEEFPPTLVIGCLSASRSRASRW